MFQKLDKNKDGQLDRNELIEGFREIYGQVVEAEVDEIMALADLNGNGEIDFSEWLVATSKRQDIVNSKMLGQAFRYFDIDGSGKISLEELKAAMGGSGLQANEDLDPEVWEDIMAEADDNGDGEIDFEEFCNMMKKLIPSHVIQQEQLLAG
jgi:calcium-dependent protein kinase